MGLHLWGRSFCKDSSHNESVIQRAKKIPDPQVFTVIDTKVIKTAIVAKVSYPGSPNYEGLKILVYEYVSDFTGSLAKQELDPHFCDKHPSPIARFEPTERGWKWAIEFAEKLTGEEK